MNKKNVQHVIDSTFARFVLVGVLNTAFGVGLYCLFIFLGMPYRIAVLLSTILGVLFNFRTIGAFVFKNTDKHLLFRFVVTYIVIYFINIGLIKLLIEFTSFNDYIAGIIATPVVAVFSYILQKRFVFNKR